MKRGTALLSFSINTTCWLCRWSMKKENLAGVITADEVISVLRNK